MECFRLLSASLAVGTLMMANFAHAEPFDPAQQPAVYSAPVALSDTGLKNGTTLYQSWFDADNWHGDLLAYTLDATSGFPARLNWSAAQSLANRNWRERLIVTRRDDNGQAIVFGQFSDLSPAQQQHLGDQATLDYLRGDQSLEGTRFRTRTHRDNTGNTVHSSLGPIIHANPIYAGDTPARVYVGANDGMLHIFAADDGHEVFAYVPGMIYQRLAALTENNGHPPPGYSVDGALTTGTVRFHDGTTHTLLVGALGAGGQGLFALDISHPDVRDEADALHSLLWEFSDRDDAELGYSYAAPQLAQLDNGRWVVLVGNGYGNPIDDGHIGSGSAQLLVIDAETGDLIRRLDTYTGGTTDPNGLSTPRAIDSNADGRIDYVYAGDLHGGLWRFDLRGDSHNWQVSCNGAPLFVARDPSGHPQAISTATVIISHPQQGVRVLFGTGRILSDLDLDTVAGAQIQSLYGVWDRLGDTCPAPSTTLKQSISEGNYDDGQRVRHSSHNLPTGNHDVWRIDLPAGERVVTDPQLSSERLAVTTTQPLTVGGEVWLLELDPQTGGVPGQVIFDMNGDGVLNSQDNMTSDTAKIGDGDEVRINGRYYGTGVGSTPVFANLSASRYVTYINRNVIGSRPDASCAENCGETPFVDGNSALLGTYQGGSIDSGGVNLTQIIPAAPPCGEQGCVAEARPNPGRVTWKELLAE